MITQERLKELLDYDPKTGIFTWVVKPSYSVPAGSAAGTDTGKGYIRIRIEGSNYFAHRLAFIAMGVDDPPEEIDHINGTPSDNRWPNLRPATRSENGRNRRKRPNTASGVRGVCWDGSRDRWVAYIYLPSRRITLGRSSSLDEAISLRLAAEVKYFGEFSATASRI